MNLARYGKAAGSSIALACITIVFFAGCNDQSEGARRGPSQTGTRGGLFEVVVENLDQFEQFDTEQIFKQTCDRLNQWYLQELPVVRWQPDPLLAALDTELRNQPEVSMLEGIHFQAPDDGWFLQEAVWLRNISNQARGDKFEDVEVAKELFDWTVRNIKLEPDTAADTALVRHRPFEILLFGRGTAIERAWVFILLARQQGLNVAYLGLADKDGQDVRPWLPALVADGQLYLFDTRLGLPIPGKKQGSVATLSEVADDDALLRKLDLDKSHPYPVTADDLKHVIAFVEATPPSLSRRMALVESRLTGADRMRLTSPGSYLAGKVAELPHVSEARLWPMPFEVYLAKARRTTEQDTAAQKEMVVYLAIPTLKLGRALYFKGELEGGGGAKAQYLNARPPDSFILDYHLSPGEAQEFLKSGASRATLAKLEAAQSLLMREAKQDASYWLGLIFFEQGDYQNAVDYLAKRTLGTKRESPWADAARYNLARTYEAMGETAKAIELYEGDKTSPQSHGNRLRAKWLKEEEKVGTSDSSSETPGEGADPERAAE